MQLPLSEKPSSTQSLSLPQQEEREAQENLGNEAPVASKAGGAPPQNTLPENALSDEALTKEAVEEFESWLNFNRRWSQADEEEKLAELILIAIRKVKALAPSVVEGVEEKRWTVTLLEHAFVVGLGKGVPPVWIGRRGNENREKLETIVAAHNASLGEPRGGVEERMKSALLRIFDWSYRNKPYPYCKIEGNTLLQDLAEQGLGYWPPAYEKPSSHSNAVLPPPVSETENLDLPGGVNANHQPMTDQP